jgi:hypothetical protein
LTIGFVKDGQFPSDSSSLFHLVLGKESNGLYARQGFETLIMNGSRQKRESLRQVGSSEVISRKFGKFGRLDQANQGNKVVLGEWFGVDVNLMGRTRFAPFLGNDNAGRRVCLV